jgi:DNA-binding XRE family transcriptional regulator
MNDSRGQVTFLKTFEMQRIEAREGRRIDDLLRGLYHDERLTQEQIADRLGVARVTVVKWMQGLGIPTGYNGGRPRATAEKKAA